MLLHRRGVAALIGPSTHHALARNETTPGLRRTTDDSPMVTLVRLWALQAAVDAAALERAIASLVRPLVEGGPLEQSGEQVRHWSTSGRTRTTTATGGSSRT